MANPRSLVSALHTHWESIETLVMLGRELPAFDEDQVLKVIARCLPDKQSGEHEQAMRQLVATDVLQIMPRGTSLQINPLVLDFVRGLTREHELGLSEVLRARVDAIKSGTERLLQGLAQRDNDLLWQAASSLSELFRQISQQLDQDRHAILEIAERAKAKDANLPIARRYREVLTAYDDYIEPMACMMDSGPEGTFYRHLEAAEHALDDVQEALTVRGALYTQRLRLRQVAFQAKELRRLGREVLTQCSDTLLPLREEVRQHNTLSAAISHLLGRVRKRGLKAALAGGQAPLWQRELARRVGLGGEVLTIMAEARSYVPPKKRFPEDAAEQDASARALLRDHVDEAALRHALQAALPVSNLLGWLRQTCPQVSDAALLRLHHTMAADETFSVEPASERSQIDLQQVRVHHHAHAVFPADEHSTGTPS